jgi:hypothetical protein
LFLQTKPTASKTCLSFIRRALTRSRREFLPGLAALGAFWALPGGAHAQIFVANYGNGTVGAYNTDGTTLTASLVTGLVGSSDVAVAGADLFVADANASVIGEYTTGGTTVNPALVQLSGAGDPNFITVAGTDVYVTNQSAGTIGEYTTAGATVNSSLVMGLSAPYGIAVSGSDLWVANGGVIGEYDATNGNVVNATLVTGLTKPIGIAVAGSNLYVTDATNNTISEYNAFTGLPVNATPTLVTGLNSPVSVAVLGADLLVSNQGNGTIGEYDATTGNMVNASLVSGLSSPSGLVVVAAIPEPSAYAALAGLGALGGALLRRRRRAGWVSVL